jgi:hypothetical protein
VRARLARVFALGAIAGCATDEPTETLSQCEGGDAPTLQIGEGGLASFTPWQDGQEVEVVDQGDLGVSLQLLSTGLDTTEPVSAVIRVTTLGSDGDAIANLSLQCPSEGPGWISVFAPLPSAVQDGGADYLDGVPATLHATATDQRGISASADLDVVLVAPTTGSRRAPR